MLAHTIVLAPNHGAINLAAAISAPSAPAPTVNTSTSSERDRMPMLATYAPASRRRSVRRPVAETSSTGSFTRPPKVG